MASSTTIIHIKRAYEAASQTDGHRILVDKLWPRGVQKQKAQFQSWHKELAPSSELRKWFNHEADKWPEFQKKYKVELSNNKEALQALIQEVKLHPVVTLIFAAKDEKHNNAVVLRTVILDNIKK